MTADALALCVGKLPATMLLTKQVKWVILFWWGANLGSLIVEKW